MLSRRRSWWQGTTALSRSLQAGMRPTPSWIVALSFKEHSPPCLARCGTTHRLARSFRITTASCSSPPPSRLSTTTRPAKWSCRQDWLSHRMASTCTSSTTAATPRPISSSQRTQHRSLPPSRAPRPASAGVPTPSQASSTEPPYPPTDVRETRLEVVELL